MAGKTIGQLCLWVAGTVCIMCLMSGQAMAGNTCSCAQHCYSDCDCYVATCQCVGFSCHQCGLDYLQASPGNPCHRNPPCHPLLNCCGCGGGSNCGGHCSGSTHCPYISFCGKDYCPRSSCSGAGCAGRMYCGLAWYQGCSSCPDKKCCICPCCPHAHCQGSPGGCGCFPNDDFVCVKCCGTCYIIAPSLAPGVLP